MPTQIGLVTCQTLPDLDPDNQRLIPELQALGLTVQSVIWNDPNVNWADFDLLVIRSTWDYHLNQKEFITWAGQVSHQTRLLNPAEVLEWNSDKIYLEELKSASIPVVETWWLHQANSADEICDLAEFMAIKQLEKIVVKPQISGAGYQTHLVSLAEAPSFQATFTELLKEHSLMLQPYLESISVVGEYSLIYLGGTLSHVVQKIPPQEAFLCHEEYGGQYKIITPNQTMLDIAEKTLSYVENKFKAALNAQPLLYGRVDLMVDNTNQLALSELEITEPSLYFKYHPQAVQTMAKLIQKELALLPQAIIR